MKFLPTKKKKERKRTKEERRPDRQQKRGMLEERRPESREKTEHQHSEVHLGLGNWKIQWPRTSCLPLAESLSKHVQRCTSRENIAKPNDVACSWITERHSSEKQSTKEQRKLHHIKASKCTLMSYRRAPWPHCSATFLPLKIQMMIVSSLLK